MADIVTTLRERPYRFASENKTDMQVRRQAEREYAANEIEVLRLEKAKIAADNERLRSALQDIITDSFSVYAIQVARAALEAHPEQTQEEA